MKKIFFDLMVSQPDLGSKFHGGGEYTKTVFKELCVKYSSGIKLIVFYDPNRFIDDWIIALIKQYNINYYHVQNYDELSKINDFQTADTFVACLMKGVDKIKKPAVMKIIGVYHGFRELEKIIDITAPLYENNIRGIFSSILKVLGKKMYFEKKYVEYKRKIELCSDIVGVSSHSGYASRVFFPSYDKNHVHVFYSPEKYIEPVRGLEEIRTEKVILMIGGDRWGKNIYRGILAVDGLFSNNQLESYRVRIVGGIPKLIRKRIKNKDRYEALNYLPTEELEKEYKTCDIFFYPTLNEGFGYPPQEAMKYGKTCVISAINSLPEIYKDSVYYCNPYDIKEMQARILQASNEKITEQIIRKHYIRIVNRQRSDLTKLCDLIVR